MTAIFLYVSLYDYKVSLDDLKKIDWQHATTSSIPTYILVGGAIVVLGIILVLTGIFI
jgi:hypothetical protein